MTNTARAERQSFTQMAQDTNVDVFHRQIARVRARTEKERNLQNRGIQTIHS